MPALFTDDYKARVSALADILEPYDARFVAVRYPGDMFDKYDKKTGKTERAKSSGKEPIGANWQQNTTATAALLRARVGNDLGNVGLMAGISQVYILDFDSDFDGVLERNPWLNDSIVIYRDNAPDRGKIVFLLPADQRLHARKKHNQMELLGPGNQGVVAGMHASGGLILWRGAGLATWSEEIIRALWLRETGDVYGDDITDERNVIMKRMELDGTLTSDIDPADEAFARNFVESSFRSGAQRAAFEPYHKKDGSGSDWAVANEFCRLGVQMDKAISMHLSLPCGHHGKTAMRNDPGYLVRTYQKAYAGREIVTNRLDVARSFVSQSGVPRTALGDDVSPRSITRRQKSCSKAALAILELMHAKGETRIPVNFVALAADPTNGLRSPKTWRSAIESMPKLFSFVPGKWGETYAFVELRPFDFGTVGDFTIESNCDAVVNSRSVFRELMLSSVTDSGVSKVVKDMCIAQAVDENGDPIKIRRRDFLRSLSFVDVQVLDYLSTSVGDESAADIATSLGLNVMTVGASLRKLLNEYGYVTRVRDGRTFLYCGASSEELLAEVNEAAFQTHLGRESAASRIYMERMAHADEQRMLAKTDDERTYWSQRWSTMFIDRYEALCKVHAWRDIDDAELQRMAYDTNVKNIKRNRAMAKHARNKPAFAALKNQVMSLMQDGLDSEQVMHMMTTPETGWKWYEVSTAVADAIKEQASRSHYAANNYAGAYYE